MFVNLYVFCAVLSCTRRIKIVCFFFFILNSTRSSPETLILFNVTAINLRTPSFAPQYFLRSRSEQIVRKHHNVGFGNPLAFWATFRFLSRTDEEKPIKSEMRAPAERSLRIRAVASTGGGRSWRKPSPHTIFFFCI